MHKSYLFNTTIATGPGTWVVKEITENEAIEIIQNCSEVISAIGHEGTAETFTQIVGTRVEVNRIHAKLQPGDRAVCLKVEGRLPEGAILTLPELKQIVYKMYSMTLQ